MNLNKISEPEFVYLTFEFLELSADEDFDPKHLFLAIFILLRTLYVELYSDVVKCNVMTDVKTAKLMTWKPTAIGVYLKKKLNSSNVHS